MSNLSYTFNGTERRISYRGGMLPAACGIFVIKSFTLPKKMTDEEWKQIKLHLKENIHRMRWENFGFAWIITNGRTNKHLVQVLSEMQPKAQKAGTSTLFEIHLNPKRKQRPYDPLRYNYY